MNVRPLPEIGPLQRPTSASSTTQLYPPRDRGSDFGAIRRGLVSLTFEALGYQQRGCQMIDTVPEQRPSLVKRRPPCESAGGFERLADSQFQAMHAAFRDHGGIMSGDTVAERLRPAFSQPISMLAKWIISRSVVSLAWQGYTMIPMFQFQPCDLSIRMSFSRVFDELKDAFDNWEAGLWFATPNAWLDDRTPVDCLDENWLDVVQAARADRFIVRG
jgi:hypothetical protein